MKIQTVLALVFLTFTLHAMEKTIEKDWEDCTICMKPLAVSGKDIVTLGCKQNPGKHSFHWACINQWNEQKKRKGTCPLCRTSLSDAKKTKHRVVSSMEAVYEENQTIREAHECVEPCYKGFKMLDNFFKYVFLASSCCASN